jgi:O-methyltransferase
MTYLPSIVAPGQIEALVGLAASTPQGCFVEVGVYMGGTASYLYQIALSQHRDLYLFDTFKGTPFCVEGLDRHRIDKEFASESTPMLIEQFMPEAKVYIGVYPETHPIELKDIAFVHCDCDQYESYRAVIEHLWPLVIDGGVLYFDDYPYLAGAKKAVEEKFTIGSIRPCGARYFVLKGAATELR